MTDDFNARLKAYLATAREDFIRANAGEVVDLVVANKPVADKPIQTNFLSDGATKQLEQWANRNAVSTTNTLVAHSSNCTHTGLYLSGTHVCDNEFKPVVHYNDIGDRIRMSRRREFTPYRYGDLRKIWRATCVVLALLFIVLMIVTGTPGLIIPALLFAVIS